MRIPLAAAAACLLIFGIASAQTKSDPEAATGFAAKPPVTAKQHMVVAANPLASQAGDAMLRKGGSAADAAIATLLVLNVVEPQSSGIGGGAFALVHGPDGLTSWDARETAPAGATPDMFMEDGETLPFFTGVLSGKSIGVPGLMRLMDVLHTKHGKLEWPALFEPAIELADNGFEVSPRLAGLLNREPFRFPSCSRLRAMPPCITWSAISQAGCGRVRMRSACCAPAFREVLSPGRPRFEPWRLSRSWKAYAAPSTAAVLATSVPADGST